MTERVGAGKHQVRAPVYLAACTEAASRRGVALPMAASRLLPPQETSMHFVPTRSDVTLQKASCKELVGIAKPRRSSHTELAEVADRIG